jgi:hypothetical protein
MYDGSTSDCAGWPPVLAAGNLVMGKVVQATTGSGKAGRAGVPSDRGEVAHAVVTADTATMPARRRFPIPSFTCQF